jgi:hypothetical protein
MHKIIHWREAKNGSRAWQSSDELVGFVPRSSKDTWWACDANYEQISEQEFASAYAACLAVENSFASAGKSFAGWLESVTGGYFRQFARGQRVFVRKADRGWYAVRRNGRVLGKAGNVAWFANYEEARWSKQC